MAEGRFSKPQCKASIVHRSIGGQQASAVYAFVLMELLQRKPHSLTLLAKWLVPVF